MNVAQSRGTVSAYQGRRQCPTAIRGHVGSERVRRRGGVGDVRASSSFAGIVVVVVQGCWHRRQCRCDRCCCRNHHGPTHSVRCCCKSSMAGLRRGQGTEGGRRRLPNPSAGTPTPTTTNLCFEGGCCNAAVLDDGIGEVQAAAMVRSSRHCNRRHHNQCSHYPQQQQQQSKTTHQTTLGGRPHHQHHFPSISAVAAAAAFLFGSGAVTAAHHRFAGGAVTWHYPDDARSRQHRVVLEAAVPHLPRRPSLPMRR